MSEQEEKTIDLGDDEVITEVEVDGAEEKVESELSVSEVSVSEVSVSEEQEEYQTSVQRRIDKLTKRMRESERREQAAVEYAQNVQNESSALKTRMKSLDEGYLSEYGGRITSEQEGAENNLRSAMELGDTDAAVVAQRKLTELAVAQERLNQAKVQQQQQAQYQQLQEQQQQQQQQAPVAASQPAAETDPKAEAWASRNEWFGKDEAMTFAAFGLHKRLVENEEFDPTSDEYYSELDKRMRNEFPQKLNGGTRKPSQTVASVSRSGSPGRSRKVRLTPSQVAIAKKLGVPLEEYAKYVKE